ncbi:MAG: fumarylacetoacetate hydrolase family protein [Candidatus Omnitrophota bacterium]|nr:fumarylacetoacetate hydrolase family protein [Candidatus Omnitrophota bacterium]MBU1928688.1 fumarylacetoacetate hydrolase family protein [Candidatus Omnitrophota bacterium]MBU2035281.1 fumarylacetoacetate hydrolase family protein [Candidatus Omnitrophota bacterium]MBU2221683.1 fumarylacetoacetate hydrolase family protein [Candidatus Omnitrophota bacterium]MBU2258441.1 fumarylacetoacetate hydrolase family protein [Candidatus Omnitrophota bacterium]
MRLVRFIYKKQIRWGVIDKDGVWPLKNPPYERINRFKYKLSLSRIKLLAPAEPSKIILVGLNYKDHARELKMKIPDEPVIFLKPPTALIGPDEKIIYPPQASRLDYEAELALVIRRKARNIPLNKVPEYILGFTCLNDVTARNLQRKDVQWSRAKSFDTFSPLGPWLETAIRVDNLRIRSFLNGKLNQDSNTNKFIFTVKKIVSFVSQVMTLLPGDVISTGTPPGVGPMKAGDKIEIDIEGIGVLRNTVVRHG